jgi:hypothetical protein
MLVPWTVRNAIEMDSLLLITSSAGLNFRIGHAPYSTGHWTHGAHDELGVGEFPGRTEAEVRSQRQGFSRGLSYFVSHPGREVELVAPKLFWLWRPCTDALLLAEGDGTTRLRGALLPLRFVVYVSHVVFGLLAIGGLILNRRDKQAVLLPAILLLLWSATAIAFFGEQRFQVAVLPILALPAAAAIVDLVRRLPARRSVPFERAV